MVKFITEQSEIIKHKFGKPAYPFFTVHTIYSTVLDDFSFKHAHSPIASEAEALIFSFFLLENISTLYLRVLCTGLPG